MLAHGIARRAGRAILDGLASAERMVPAMRPSCAALRDHGRRAERAGTHQWRFGRSCSYPQGMEISRHLLLAGARVRT
jgi:hypothetical protein